MYEPKYKPTEYGLEFEIKHEDVEEWKKIIKQIKRNRELFQIEMANCMFNNLFNTNLQKEDLK